MNKIATNNFKKFLAFTVAEILITLGIIGIVAEMTIPVLLTNTQKEVTVNKLKSTYSMLAQAIKLSEIDNGQVENWDFGTANDGTATLAWFNTYLQPYMKVAKTETETTRAMAYLTNGVILKFWNAGGNQVHVLVYINGADKVTIGKDYFMFFIGGNPIFSSSNELRPYDYNLTAPVDRNTLINDATRGCKKTVENRNYCAALIIVDGWKISSDYPFFN